AARVYLADMTWALRYADANRRHLLAMVVDTIAAVLAAAPDESTLVTCHHNHVRRETHPDRALWVHRKGAIPAALDEPGIIPGSMGSPSYHVTGRGHPGALASSAHGAGRCL